MKIIQFENNVFFKFKIIFSKKFSKPKTKKSISSDGSCNTSTIFNELQVINERFSMKMVEKRNYAKGIALFPTLV